MAGTEGISGVSVEHHCRLNGKGALATQAAETNGHVGSSPHPHVFLSCRHTPLQVQQVNVHESLHGSTRLHQALRGLRLGLHHRVEMLSLSLTSSAATLSLHGEGQGEFPRTHGIWPGPLEAGCIRRSAVLPGKP